MPPILNVNDKDQRGHLKRMKKQWKQEKLLKRLQKYEDENRDDGSTKSRTEEMETKLNLDCSTLSIAIPGSILENAQSAELRTYLAGQIARAACIFKIDEVIVFDDLGTRGTADSYSIEQDDGMHVTRPCCAQLARILQYLECPQYLRKLFFPIHKDLTYAGILNPLDAPHHLRQNDEFPFREGIVANRIIKSGKGSLVNVGLHREVIVDRTLTPGIRVTVKMIKPNESSKKLRGTVVSPLQPRAEIGVYWGYSVRVASSLSTVFSQAPYKSGYDLTIGTSDKGASVDNFSKKRRIPYQHALVVFGGLQGLEAALEVDEVLKVDDPALLFDHYLNTCTEQGSRTIRTEEAILISLAVLRKKLVAKEDHEDEMNL